LIPYLDDRPPQRLVLSEALVGNLQKADSIHKSILLEI
jgi:hypothetical protein